MNKVDAQFIHTLLKEKGAAIAANLCRRVEDFENVDSLSAKDSRLLKSQLKNALYESFRDLELHVKFYSEGRTLTKYPIYKPSNTEKEL